MQRNTVQCFGYRIDNLKCVPICTRRSLQMSVSFLFTWQIAETPKRLLHSFSCILCNFFFFCILFSAFRILCLHYWLFKAYLCTAMRTSSILHRLLFRSSRVDHSEQLFSMDCLTVMSYFYRWITILQNLSEQEMYYSHFGWEKSTWDCFPELPGKCDAERVFHLKAPAALSTGTFLLPKH